MFQSHTHSYTCSLRITSMKTKYEDMDCCGLYKVLTQIFWRIPDYSLSLTASIIDLPRRAHSTAMRSPTGPAPITRNFFPSQILLESYILCLTRSSRIFHRD